MTTRTRGEADTRRWQLWFGVGAGPIVWSAHLLVVYALTSLSCYQGFFRFTIFGIDGLRVILVLVTLIFAGIVAAAGYLSYGRWRAHGNGVEDEVGQTAVERGRPHFMALLGVLLNALFIVATLAALVPIVWLRPCA